MNKYEFDDGKIYYSLWDVEVCDIDGETVVFTNAIDDEDEAMELYLKLSPSAGAKIYLRELQYSNSNHTGYLRTVVRQSK